MCLLSMVLLSHVVWGHSHLEPASLIFVTCTQRPFSHHPSSLVIEHLLIVDRLLLNPLILFSLQGDEILNHFKWLCTTAPALTTDLGQLLLLVSQLVLYRLSLLNNLLLKISYFASKPGAALRRLL